ncbi:MAG: GNAT family N-acetyltransferase [Candidatus Obscuribacterales bacterium]|nr:GNAT family N-acetyltransferase [Steroidobacteraceae bacterium]
MSVEALADANMIESLRAYGRWQQGSELQDSYGMLLLAGATSFPASFMNAAIRIDASLAPEPAIELARQFFRQRNRSFTFVTLYNRDAALDACLEKQDFKLDSESPCMLVESPVFVPKLAAGACVVKLIETSQIKDVITIGAAAYVALGLPAEQAAAAFGNDQALLDDRIAGVIVYLDDQPAAMALTIMSGREAELTAGVYWVGTVPSARGKGLGELCTALATNVGFERGARIVTLQASPDGEPLYRRMGYREYNRQRRYRQINKPRD